MNREKQFARSIDEVTRRLNPKYPVKSMVEKHRSKNTPEHYAHLWALHDALVESGITYYERVNHVMIPPSKEVTFSLDGEVFTFNIPLQGGLNDQE